MPNNVSSVIYYYLDWVAVQFIDDKIFQLCPAKSIKKKIVIGNNYFVKYKDGFKYLAVILKKGSKFIVHFST